MSRKELYKQKRYEIFACYYCHEWQYSNIFQKTHKCIKCGKILLLSRVNPAFETNELQEAIKFLQELKKQIGLKNGWDQYITAEKLFRNLYSQHKK